jgi:hypothetical protein
LNELTCSLIDTLLYSSIFQTGNTNPSCKFEINQLTKVVSARLQMNAKQAFQLIDQLRFSQKDYQTMLAKVCELSFEWSNGIVFVFYHTAIVALYSSTKDYQSYC